LHPPRATTRGLGTILVDELVTSGSGRSSQYPGVECMETVLLVDDNALRASIRRAALEDSATMVVRAPDAAEALCTIETPEVAGRLGLVVTGHQMSGISGPEFVAELRQRMPEIPVLVLNQASGFEGEYQGISGVYFSENPSAEELHTLAVNLLAMVGERQTA